MHLSMQCIGVSPWISRIHAQSERASAWKKNKDGGRESKWERAHQRARERAREKLPGRERACTRMCAWKNESVCVKEQEWKNKSERTRKLTNNPDAKQLIRMMHSAFSHIHAHTHTLTHTRFPPNIFSLSPLARSCCKGATTRKSAELISKFRVYTGPFWVFTGHFWVCAGLFWVCTGLVLSVHRGLYWENQGISSWCSSPDIGETLSDLKDYRALLAYSVYHRFYWKCYTLVTHQSEKFKCLGTHSN